MSSQTAIALLRGRMRIVLIAASVGIFLLLAAAGWFVLATFTRVADATAGGAEDAVVVRIPDPLVAETLRVTAASRISAPTPEFSTVNDPFVRPVAAPAAPPATSTP